MEENKISKEELNHMDVVADKIQDAINYAISNQVLPLVIIGMFEAVKIDLIMQFNKPLPGHSNPANN